MKRIFVPVDSELYTLAQINRIQEEGHAVVHFWKEPYVLVVPYDVGNIWNDGVEMDKIIRHEVSDSVQEEKPPPSASAGGMDIILPILNSKLLQEKITELVGKKLEEVSERLKEDNRRRNWL